MPDVRVALPLFVFFVRVNLEPGQTRLICRSVYMRTCSLQPPRCSRSHLSASCTGCYRVSALILVFPELRALERATLLQSGRPLFATTPSAEDDERKKSHQTQREHACVCVCVHVCVCVYICLLTYVYDMYACGLSLFMIYFALSIFALVNLEYRI